MRTPDLDLDLVRCFVSVVETGGFTQASKCLHLTQSAVTLKIKRLEDLLQQRLFRKTVPPLELTLEGEIVLGYAFRLLELNREMVLRVTKPAANATIRLGIITHFGYHFLPQWLSEFKRVWPKIRLVTDMGMTTELLKGLGEDRFDLVIASAGYTGLSQYKTAPLVHEQHLQKEKLIWVQAENSVIDPRKDPLPLVMFGPLCRFRPLCLDALQKAGRTWEIVYDGGSLNSVQSAVEADLGLSVLNALSLKPGIEIAGKKAGLPPLPTSDLAFYSRKNPSDQTVQKLTDFIVEQVAHWERGSQKRETASKRLVTIGKG
ncbi:MAG TPA: LysR family transcriptional regulator [Candidatus Methylacidiphilales bacterium]|nr:LysR family transcriptional regulator [Candidatus Methylacidiphilales bacterium]